jgi:hypothetical protein
VTTSWFDAAFRREHGFGMMALAPGEPVGALGDAVMEWLEQA